MKWLKNLINWLNKGFPPKPTTPLCEGRNGTGPKCFECLKEKAKINSKQPMQMIYQMHRVDLDDKEWLYVLGFGYVITPPCYQR